MDLGTEQGKHLTKLKRLGFKARWRRVRALPRCLVFVFMWRWRLNREEREWCWITVRQ